MHTTDVRLERLFERQKVRFLDKGHHLLGTPYPADALTPVWNSALGPNGGQAEVGRMIIQINPKLYLPRERQELLERVILHEMLHVYVCKIHKYAPNPKIDPKKGHGGSWEEIAEYWDIPSFHTLDTWHFDGTAQSEDYLDHATDRNLRHIHRFQKAARMPRPDPFQKVRKLP
jgi:hypothetical protein